MKIILGYLFLKAIYSKFKSTTVHNALNRLKTYSDYGYDKQALGFNDSAFASMFNDSETDNDIFIPGKLSLSESYMVLQTMQHY